MKKHLFAGRLWLIPGLSTALIILVLQGIGCAPPRAAETQKHDGSAWWEEEVQTPNAPYKASSYYFCFWNLENFFDDHNDHRTGPDEEYDLWFSEAQSDLELKLKHISEALLAMNGGRGPDIIAVAEVESDRAAHFLMNALNHGSEIQKNPDLRYRHVLFKEVNAGRHIATAIITRVAVDGSKTHLLDSKHRILESHLSVDGHELVLLTSHWTSRKSDHDGTDGTGRAKYADMIYGRYKAMYHSNPKVDFLVCGDFNDTPDDKSVVDHLHATSDVQAVEHSTANDPLLLDLFAGKDPKDNGTHYYDGHWFIFDQIAVSPGLLDHEGWHCDVESAHAIRTLVRKGDKSGRPWSFGNRKHNDHERGYSDHFPVTALLKVE
jgi:endonuclease/exonuclease/phosphatase family metal-dependent hydrolase